MIKMRTSGENLARSEARNVIKCEQARLSGLVWNGKNPSQGITAYFTPASPLKRVFYWARFHQTARKRLQVRNLCTDVCLNLKQDNQAKSGSDCAHCQPACEAAIGRPDPLKGLSADLSEGRLSTSLLTEGGHKGGDWLEPFTGKKGKLWVKE